MNFSRLYCAWLFSLPLLAACGKSALPVSIHGVNYSVEPFSFELRDPNNPKNRGDGELVDSYAAGGTTCCYELPKKWQPGLKVIVQSKHWLGKAVDDSLHDVAGTQVIDIPRYPDEKPGELWVLRAANGTMDIVSSDFQPDHPKWPGNVKGWPVPSLAYKRERWDLYIKEQLDYVIMFENLIREFNKFPEKMAQEDWDVSMKNNRKNLAGFSGPGDARFRVRLKKEYEQGLIESRAELNRLKAGRP